MAARKAGKPLDVARVNKLFAEMAKLAPFVPIAQDLEINPLPPLIDSKTGALMSRSRYTNTSASVFES